MTYMEAQQDVLSSLGEGCSAASLLDAWSAFVEEVEEGYAWDESEYRNEVRVRGQIELVMEAESLQKFVEHREFRENVQRVDSQFLSNSHPTWKFPWGGTWWESAVPVSSRGDFAECYRRFGFT